MRKIPILIILILACFNQALSDRWLPPKVTDYYSANKKYFARIVPRTVPENYYVWRKASVSEKKKFLPSDTAVVQCHAIMYKKTQSGDSILWTRKLINAMAPVSAIVSDDGGYLVTFDNWHSVGYGVDVMVFYDKKGDLVKRHMLEDISPFPINDYPTSISSLWWRCGQQFVDNRRVEICFVSGDEKIEKRIYNLEEKRIE
ncbi:MAG TPA: hypothetical protein VIM65_01335 [Cyclobacteriaceae bacterium]